MNPYDKAPVTDKEINVIKGDSRNGALTIEDSDWDSQGVLHCSSREKLRLVSVWQGDSPYKKDLRGHYELWR